MKEPRLNKIKDNRGASLVISLVIFLVASMVSITIVSAALTAVKRVNNDKEETAAYYAVSSAAKLFSEQLKNSSCTVIKTETTMEEEDEDGNVLKSVDERTDYECSGPLRNVLLDIIKRTDHMIPEYDRTLEITVSDEESEYPDLTCSVILHINPASPNGIEEYENELDVYKMTADFECRENHIFMSAWIPNAPDPQKTVTTETIGRTTITTVQTEVTYVWSGIDLSSISSVLES